MKEPFIAHYPPIPLGSTLPCHATLRRPLRDADVIDVFYDSTGDIPQTVKLCEETAGIGEAPPVAPPDLEKEPPPDATNLATGLAGHPAVATVVPPPGFADASAEASKTTVAGKHVRRGRKEVEGLRRD